MTNRFAKDSADILLRRFSEGGIDRRGFLAALGALGLSVALRPGAAQAAENEVVLCNWGGAAVDAFQQAFGGPFSAKTGMKLVIDGAGPAIGSVRTMVDSGNVTWDVMDNGLVDAQVLSRGNYLEPIDYAIVDKSKVPDFAQEFGVGNYAFANVLFHNKKTTGVETLTDWKDFFDFEKIPGKRTMCKWIQGQLEMVLLADGVAPADLYPLDVDRAFAKLEPHLDQIIFWEGGAQSQQLFRDGEVVMGNIWHTRAKLLIQENADYAITWNQNALQISAWSVPRGNPSGKKVFEFINSALDPEPQITLLRLMGNGPTNPAAEAMMTDEDRVFNPTSPANKQNQVLVNPSWYAEHEAETQNKFLDLIST
jgi:putative spermidine/putrescine transport system substrate-binding protein